MEEMSEQPYADSEYAKIVGESHLRNASQRLPVAIFHRYCAGDSVDELAEDYELPREQIEWGIRIGHLLKKLGELD